MIIMIGIVPVWTKERKILAVRKLLSAYIYIYRKAPFPMIFRIDIQEKNKILEVLHKASTEYINMVEYRLYSDEAVSEISKVLLFPENLYLYICISIN